LRGEKLVLGGLAKSVEVAEEGWWKLVYSTKQNHPSGPKSVEVAEEGWWKRSKFALSA
jgi:hypothetical protein